MDIFAHFLWTFALFFKRKDRWLAGLFGILPDVASFGPHFILSFVAGTTIFGRPELSTIPGSVFILYNLTHSLVVFALAVLIIYFITKKIYWFITGWGLHVLIDIPTHTKDFFPTPFLYPFPQPFINGIRWSDSTFMKINYGLLVIVYGILIYWVLKNEKK